MIAFCVPILASRCIFSFTLNCRAARRNPQTWICVSVELCPLCPSILLLTFHHPLVTGYQIHTQKALGNIAMQSANAHIHTLTHRNHIRTLADYISNSSLMEPQLPCCDEGLAFLLYAEEKYFTQEVSRREKEAKWKLNLTLSCPVWVLANKLQLFGGSESELSVSLVWRGFIFVMFSVSSPWKTTNPEVQ